MKTGKSLGVDNVPSELVKHSWELTAKDREDMPADLGTEEVVKRAVPFASGQKGGPNYKCPKEWTQLKVTKRVDPITSGQRSGPS